MCTYPMDFVKHVDHLCENLDLKVDLCTWREIAGSFRNTAVDSTEGDQCLSDS